MYVYLLNKRHLLAQSQNYLPVRGWPNLIMFLVHAQELQRTIEHIAYCMSACQGTSGDLIHPLSLHQAARFGQDCVCWKERAPYSYLRIYVCSDSADEDPLQQMSNPGKKLWNSGLFPIHLGILGWLHLHFSISLSSILGLSPGTPFVLKAVLTLELDWESGWMESTCLPLSLSSSPGLESWHWCSACWPFPRHCSL